MIPLPFGASWASFSGANLLLVSGSVDAALETCGFIGCNFRTSMGRELNIQEPCIPKTEMHPLETNNDTIPKTWSFGAL